MAQGKKDLTGPSGRDRVIRIIETLADQNCLSTVEEANSLLAAAGQPPLYDGQPAEARLLTRLMRAGSGHRVRRTNLPAPLAGFVGRAQEIADVRGLLNQSRLVTLTGSGGAGKTRLAQRVAADVLLQFPDGVWYAELATLTDAALITETVARIFGLSTSSQTSFDDLAHLLRERHMLLVLDNCEHLIDGAADFAQRLLNACARMSILATSREALNVEGETTWRVPPMQPNEAAKLFVERAKSAQPQQPLREDDATVAHICARLDGMPLALELAAARLNALSLSDIAARLDNRFALLTEGRRGALPRHQTLQALIDWSYELLSAQEKIVFRRLGVFMGGWTLQTASQVLCDDDEAERDVLPLLSQLVRKSLVTVEERAGETRYSFLETIRQYALERLADHGELDVTRQQHAEVFMHMAEASTEPLHGPAQREWLARLRQDYPNLQAAMSWCLESGGDALTGCRLIGALFHFWRLATEYRGDTQDWIRAAKRALTNDMPPAIHAWVWLDEEWFIGDWRTAEERCRHIHELFVQAGDLVHAAMAKTIIGRAVFYDKVDYPLALRWTEEGVNDARALDAGWVLRFNLEMLGECTRYAQHDPARAEASYREAMALSKAAGDTLAYARTLGFYMSGFAEERLQFEDSMRCNEEAMTVAETFGDVQAIMHNAYCIAESLFYLNRRAEAMQWIETSASLAAEHQSIHSIVSAKTLLARMAMADGDFLQAGLLLKESLNLRRARTQPGEFLWGAHTTMDAMAALAGAQGQAQHAACLRGIADNFIMLNHHYRPAHIAWEYAPHIAKARAALGDAAYDAAYAEGHAMTTEQAIAYALGGHDRT
jgi:predicted ATPase